MNASGSASVAARAGLVARRAPRASRRSPSTCGAASLSRVVGGRRAVAKYARRGGVLAAGPNCGSQKRFEFGSLPRLTSRSSGIGAPGRAAYEAKLGAVCVGVSGVSLEPNE